MTDMGEINCIFGLGGFAKEVHWIINDCFEAGHGDFRPHYFVEKSETVFEEKYLNEVDVIAEDDLISFFPNTNIRAFIAIGNPTTRGKIFSNLKERKNFSFPSIKHPAAIFDKRDGYLRMGKGCIVSANAVLSTDVTLEDFVHVDYGATIGHGSRLMAFARISPGANISGNVTIGRSVYIGAGAIVLENLDICEGVIIGAGAVVVSSITEKGTYVGVPARRLERTGP